MITDSGDATHYIAGIHTHDVAAGTEENSYTFSGVTVGLSDDGVRHHVFTDHLATVTGTLEYGLGVASVERLRYSPYGDKRGSTGVVAGDRTYTGQVDDMTATGLMFYNARYYDPVARNFVSPDTIIPDPASSLGWNRYAYVNNNPINYSDPSGHCPYGTDPQCAGGGATTEGGEAAPGPVDPPTEGGTTGTSDVFNFPAITGIGGIIKIDLFITDGWFAGDARRFDPHASPSDSRVQIYLDPENGVGRVTQSSSCGRVGRTDCNPPNPLTIVFGEMPLGDDPVNWLRITGSEDNFLRIDFSSKQSLAPLPPSIDGTFVLVADGELTFEGEQYPSIGAYHFVVGSAPVVLFEDEQTGPPLISLCSRTTPNRHLSSRGRGERFCRIP